MRKTLATLSMAAILVAACSVKEDDNQAEGSTISTSDQADEAALQEMDLVARGEGNGEEDEEIDEIRDTGNEDVVQKTFRRCCKRKQ